MNILSSRCGWMICIAAAAWSGAASADQPALQATILREAEATVKAFNSGDATAIGGMFHDNGELVDENGAIHSGKAEITELFKAVFTKFPKAVLEMQVTSVRPLGDSLAVEEGERRITVGDGAASSQVQYVAVRSRQGDRWPIASYREFADDPLPTPEEMLAPLAWLVGDWVDESPAARAAISYRWSEDGNFLLGDYTIAAGGAESKSSQRIGWDPVAGQLRSWTFDSDGGFTEGEWAANDEGWTVVSEATLPDGTTGSATMMISVKDADHFVVRSAGRVVGGEEQPDFEVVIARKPPQPGAKK